MELEKDELEARTSSFNHDVASLQHSLSARSRSRDNTDDEVELQWAVIERLPTYNRLKSALLDPFESQEGSAKKVVDVTSLKAPERRLFIEKLIRNVEDDNHRLLEKIRERMDMVGVTLPTIEVRYKNLCVDIECEVVHGKPLPTVWNSIQNLFSIPAMIGCNSQAKISILKNLNGALKPSRMTLLLGPPGCGKTTLLLALAGKLYQSLKVKGEISYNGYKLEEFIPQKTSAYISQRDLHIPEMTVRETLDFSARCQGTGSRTETMVEVIRREKQAGRIPESNVDAYMKGISIDGLKRTLQTDYIMKILGLDVCADTLFGDAMRRGISGGQQKRLTTGEMIIGPTKALFMDEISNGLDSSTTFQIVSYIQQLVHITDATALVSLLQPATETFDLFDDIILMAEGKILYHGPRSQVLEFFEHCGFKCPERKGVADFLQEILSRKDQEQYWCRTDLPYRYISLDQFLMNFMEHPIGRKLQEEISKPCDKAQCHKNALSFDTYSMKKWELFKVCMEREYLLMKRNMFIYVFKSLQITFIALISMTVFLRTRMKVDIQHAKYFMGSLFYALVRVLTNGIAELSMTVSRLPIFYKQRDIYFYPAWAYSIPSFILKIPVSLVELLIWTALTYYVIGYSPEFERFCRQFLILFALHQAATSLFRFLGSVFQSEVAAQASSILTLLLLVLFSSFLIPRSSLPAWLRWAFWATPTAYAEIGVALNEFLAPRWQKDTLGNKTTGDETLTTYGLSFHSYFYWISLGALFGFTILFNIGFTLALTYSKSQKPRAIISREKFLQLQVREDCENRENLNNRTSKTVAEMKRKGKMVLPFEPLSVAFRDVKYFVDTPKEMRNQGYPETKLQLLHDITGTFRPGVLTALMGASGAGKTTILDVLAGRKTGGTIEGDIHIGGYPKIQKYFARISAYCEQSDIHSPQITVEESVIFSAWLRLPPEIARSTKAEFVREVLETIELDGIKDTLVGFPGVSGLSTEQRKRLTIAVELVSNPSIIFMDEPTSGLDARAAAIVMRAVKNIVESGRTVVCTIHQPSIHIFEVFDELILMKRGGQIIYSGPLGYHSSKLIEYFQKVPGLPMIRDNYNPATWMLEVTSTFVEAQLGIDFAQLYRESILCKENKELVKRLSKPYPDSKELHFLTRFPQNGWEQFKACLWKQHLSYWRSPTYNLSRLMVSCILASLLAAFYWQKGKKINNEQDLFNISGALFLAIVFVAFNNCSTVLQYVATERIVLYREQFAGMYSSWAYSLAQAIIELPYGFFQAFLFVVITYPSIGFSPSPSKILWYFYFTFSAVLYSNYLGMLIMSLSPNMKVASVWALAIYTMLNLFAGFLLPPKNIPKWWIWCYWICPSAWSLNGYLTSQYGNRKEEITAYGQVTRLDSFLEDYYGYHHDRLGLVAFVLLATIILFASLFTWCIAKLNFQRR